jgi:hypothetical protein
MHHQACTSNQSTRHYQQAQEAKCASSFPGIRSDGALSHHWFESCPRLILPAVSAVIVTRGFRVSKLLYVPAPLKLMGECLARGNQSIREIDGAMAEWLWCGIRVPMDRVIASLELFHSLLDRLGFILMFTLITKLPFPAFVLFS